MIGRDFIACAERLAQSSDEADLRSAVSRAYYGAFHEVRSLLQDFGVLVPKTEQVHVKMEYCLRDCGDPVAAGVGLQLNLLRGKRKNADYDLDNNRYTTTSAVRSEITRARGILDGVAKVRSAESAGSQFKLRAQAKLLGLTVSD